LLERKPKIDCEVINERKVKEKVGGKGLKLKVSD
jgi:hypothetical protein